MDRGSGEGERSRRDDALVSAQLLKARRVLLPWSAAAPLTAGAMLIAAERFGLVGAVSGMATLAGLCALLFAAAVILTSARLSEPGPLRPGYAPPGIPGDPFRTRLALECAGLGMWSVDPRSMTLETDAKFRELFGVQAAELDYESAMAMIHRDDQESVRRAVAASSRELDPVAYDVEYRVCRPDGSQIWVHAMGRSSATGSDAPGYAVAFGGTVADITRRKTAESEREALLTSERAARAVAERASIIKDEFLATLSHEIRTPLTAILGWAQITRRASSAEEITAGLDVITRNAKAQLQMVDDLLDMSSIISGKVRLQARNLDLTEVIIAAIENARPTAETKGLRIFTEIDLPAALKVSGDAARLQQVLWNLLANAIKFTGRGGHVCIGAQHIDNYIEVTVADSGEGIPEEFLPFVFDRFRQADASAARQHGGLGLGLSIVKQIAELHGGSVRVGSLGRGRGTTFFVTLPVSTLPDGLGEPAGLIPIPARAALAETSAVGISVQGLRVLVIDDEDDTRTLIHRVLTPQGAVVKLARGAREGFLALQAEAFDVLISDIGMPGEDGYSLIRRVRDLDPAQGGNIPAIALTAFARAEDEVRARGAGFDLHVSKPVDTYALIRLVAAAAQQRGTVYGGIHEKAG